MPDAADLSAGRMRCPNCGKVLARTTFRKTADGMWGVNFMCSPCPKAPAPFDSWTLMLLAPGLNDADVPLPR